jgi:hypothetical protein
MKKPNGRKNLMKQADDLWRDCVKLRDLGCSIKSGFPHREPNKDDFSKLNAHHIFTRSNLATRWNLDNGVTLTSGEHIFWAHKQAVESTMFFKEHLGEDRFNKLVETSHAIVKWGVPQLIELVEQLKKEKKILQSSYDEYWNNH